MATEKRRIISLIMIIVHELDPVAEDPKDRSPTLQEAVFSHFQFRIGQFRRGKAGGGMESIECILSGYTIELKIEQVADPVIAGNAVTCTDLGIGEPKQYL